ncbi:hypothetical protein PHJA_001087600 [Phtheirospermum japonicum]|uniref:Uncharacterized protein n=1 Tax=Phtheirospermum japonicum TaxID=374723 RepID=A0A830BPI8_9LAMI|nr:hypothetical protein PHJA_001087600 [Phtheirospermum japonicum]
MQSSSVVFNTKPVLAAIHANSCYHHSKDNFNSTLLAANFNLAQSKNPITLRQHRCRRSRVARPVSSKSTWRRRLSSEFNELRPQSRLPDKCQEVSCFHSHKRKQFSVKRFTSGFFVDKSTFHLRKHKLDNAKVRHQYKC